MNRTNNVHVSGELINDVKINNNIAELHIGSLNSDGGLITTIAHIDAEQWKRFKESFPNDYTSLTVSGTLKTTGYDTYYIDVVKESNSISCFHNNLKNSLNETGTYFYGTVILKKKFDFNTNSHLYLKRMILEAANSTTFEAIALRNIVTYFNEIEEGTKLLIKADFVDNAKGFPPYWRICSKPEILH